MTLPGIENAAAAAASLARRAESAHPEELKARQAAQEFEALLLAQLTSSLGPTESESEEGGDLFGGSAAGMYRQMFGEQVALSMAKDGGIGLGGMIMNSLEARRGGAHASGRQAPLEQAIAAARALRENLSPHSASPAATPLSPADPALATRPRRVFPAATQASSESRPVNALSEKVEMELPVEGRITSHFGSRRDPIRGDHRFHRGIDFAAPKGTPIGAVAEGRVIFSGRQGGYGNTVVIEHADGRQTRYAHAARLLVQQGDYVRSGQVIATVGSTGRSTGPHLHFEISEDGRQIDPLTALANELPRGSR